MQILCESSRHQEWKDKRSVGAYLAAIWWGMVGYEVGGHYLDGFSASPNLAPGYCLIRRCTRIRAIEFLSGILK